MITQSRKKSLSANKGFSAVELIAVATIIAILALILIPILTSQVEKSRETAVKDEMGQITKVITLAYAETNRYFRLQDYDNLKLYRPTIDPLHDPATEVPVMQYNGAIPDRLSDSDRSKLSKIWEGPYTAFHNASTVADTAAIFPYAFTQTPSYFTTATAGGPIYVTGSNEGLDLYPLDPWKNPYLFFAPGTYSPTVTGFLETIYSPVLYSLGPDGLPGNKTDPTGVDYWPVAGGPLGTGDDVIWKF